MSHGLRPDPDDPDATGTRSVASAAVRSLTRRIRVRQGWSRVRSAFWPIVQASAAAGVAYAIAHYWLGHDQPFFAAVAAWVCLGFSLDRELRRVAEVAIGVAVGVAMGDLMVHLIGSGWWQLTVVLLISALLARFIDRGPLLVTQAGVQAIVVVGLPAAVASEGAFGRWTDALIGGAVALAVTLLTPDDPRRRLRALATEATTELAETLESVARGLADRDVDELAAALVRGRASEPVLADWLHSARRAGEVARVSVNRAQHDDIVRLAQQAVLVDRAMRSVRLLARRSTAVVGPDGAWPEVRPLAAHVQRCADGVRGLASDLSHGHAGPATVDRLLDLAREADPHTLGQGNLRVSSLAVLLRSPLVDLMETAGVRPRAAREALPEL